jgi:hypothetical protein
VRRHNIFIITEVGLADSCPSDFSPQLIKKLVNFTAVSIKVGKGAFE